MATPGSPPGRTPGEADPSDGETPPIRRSGGADEVYQNAKGHGENSAAGSHGSGPHPTDPQPTDPDATDPDAQTLQLPAADRYGPTGTAPAAGRAHIGDRRPAPAPKVRGPGATWPKAPRFQPVARFEDPYQIKPQRYTAAQAQIPPSIPQDPLLPYLSPGTPRKRRSEWPVLALGMIIAVLVLAACCMAGFALYAGSVGR